MAGGRGQRAAHRHGQPSASAARTQAPASADPSLDSFASDPVRIYPLERPRTAAATASSPSLLQALQAIPRQVVVVGVLCTNPESHHGVFTLMNRLVGRPAFNASDAKDSALCTDTTTLHASIHLYYHAHRSIAFLLGVSKPDSLFLAGLAEGDDANRDFEAEMAAFTSEKRKLELLMHTSSHVLFHLNAAGAFTSNILRETRALASEKQSLLAQLNSTASSTTATTKPLKTRQDKGGSGSSSTGAHVNVFTPGRCVPIVMFVLPASDEATASSSLSSTKSKSSTAAYCKATENMLCTLFRSLRGGVVGIARARDALTPASLSKERRVFHVDPTHCVAVISRATASESGDIQHRYEAVLDSLSFDLLTSPETSELDTDSLLQPLQEDDVGFPQIVQHMNRCVDLVVNASASPPLVSTGSKDATTVRTDLPTLAQWLKGFQSLAKTLFRMETKKKQEGESESTRHLFDHLDVRA